MSARELAGREGQRIGELQRSQQQEELRRALRALLMRPLMGPGDEDFPAVRRQQERLREWFLRETGWPLQVERDGARLFKRPASLGDPTRGLKGYSRQRYILLCLACAVLERADPQITLRLLGERLMLQASEPGLVSRGFRFTLANAPERRDLVHVCRTLLNLGVLERVAGDEENFIHDNGSGQSDALYDVGRRALAGVLAAVRGPSTWRAGEEPADFEQRLRSLVAEHVADSEQGRRELLRHHLSRLLLDDPVVYLASLDPEQLAYFSHQRGAMAARLAEASGLIAEQRAEGVALADESGELTDVAMPSEGTESHATLLTAEFLAGRLREDSGAAWITGDAVTAFLRGARDQYGRLWRKSAQVPGAEEELARIALEKLEGLQLIRRSRHGILPLPAIARFSVGDPLIRNRNTEEAVESSLFEV